MNKVMTLHDAVEKYVENGDTLAIGGFTTNRKPYATVSEILRQGKKDFIVYAGPGGGTPEKPVGLVYIGVLAGDRVRIDECHFRGDRRAVRERTRGRALLILRELLTPEMPNR